MSSPATLLSIVCQGLQDARIFSPRGQPDIKNYAKVLKKTTRWAAQWSRVEFDGRPQFGQRATVTIPRKGELLSQVTLVATMPDIYSEQKKAQEQANPGAYLGPFYGWTNSLGHALIDLLEFDIGGVTVDTMDGRFLEMYDELYESNSSARAKNSMIQRIPNGFGPQSIGISSTPTTVSVPLPFWFSKNCYANALPLDALSADSVQIHVTLKSFNQLYFSSPQLTTTTESVTKNTCNSVSQISGSKFYRRNPTSSTLVYNSSDTTIGISGELIPNISMKTNFQIQDMYLLCEFISLEDAEAIAFRSTQLEYRVEQHYIVPKHETQGSANVRIQLPYNNPVKDIMWVAQRPEAENFNAWFLFTRDLQSSSSSPNSGPWWPDAILKEDGQSKPAFRNAYSEPIQGARLTLSNITRFAHLESPSMFRSLIPILHYRKAPLFNRYIYAYPFGLAPGASDDQELGSCANPRGYSNWDKLPKKELHLTMNPDSNKNYPNMNIYVYVTIYNVFRVFGGRGVMLFAY
jgi:hypothetical protein